MKPADAAFAVLMFSLAQSGVAEAQTASIATSIDRLDTDGDGLVSRAEIAEAREWLFERLDTNRDGNLDASEIETLRDAIMDRAIARQARLGRQWRMMDANGDDLVSTQEFRIQTLLFDLADRDGDGMLSPAEFSVIRSLLVGRPG